MILTGQAMSVRQHIATGPNMSEFLFKRGRDGTGGVKPAVKAALFGLLMIGGPAASAQTVVDWPTYTGDISGSKYKPLDQINASNFSRLEVAWRFKTDNIGNRPEFKLEGTPLEVGGVVYATAGSRRAVVALDAVTGELLWVHGEKEGARGAAAPRQLSGRGPVYWSDGKEARILYVTPAIS